MNDKISNKDKAAWEKFLLDEEKLPNKDLELNKKKTHKVKKIDLHGYTLQSANEKITELINDSYDEGVSKIIVVTGKGLHSNVEKDPYKSKDLSILKYSVPEFIENNSELINKIVEIKGADIEDGGSGTLYIYLKKKLKNKL